MNPPAQACPQGVLQGPCVDIHALFAELVPFGAAVDTQGWCDLDTGTVLEQADVVDEDAAEGGIVVLRALILWIASRNGPFQVIVGREKGCADFLILAQAQGSARLVVVVARDGKRVADVGRGHG